LGFIPEACFFCLELNLRSILFFPTCLLSATLRRFRPPRQGLTRQARKAGSGWQAATRRATLGATAGPALPRFGPRTCPESPAAAPLFKKTPLENLYLVEPNENGTAMIQWLADAPPQAPFYASIFNYFLSENLQGYAEYDAETLALVQRMPGYLGYESMKQEGRGTFISYWADMASIQNWAAHPVHQKAKELGRSTWYRYYHSFVAEVQHARFHAH